MMVVEKPDSSRMAEDVIYFDPSDTSRPMGLNLLEARTEGEKFCGFLNYQSNVQAL